MSEFLDKKRCFELDPLLMEQILAMFDKGRVNKSRSLALEVEAGIG